MQTALITGANGVLGQAQVKCLKACNQFNIIKTSRQSHSKDVLKLDVTDFDKVREALEAHKPDVIFHLAATFSHDFDDAYSVNVAGAKNILDSVVDLELSSRIVFIGSAAEYGVVSKNDNPIAEDQKLNPVSVYGLTKSWQTQLAYLYASKGIDVVVARAFNFESSDYGGNLFIGRLHSQVDAFLKKDIETIEFGPLSALRDYVSIEEAAQQILKICLYGKSGSVYNVASGKAICMRDMVQRCLNQYELDFSIVREADNLSNRVGYDVPVIYADMTRTLKLEE